MKAYQFSEYMAKWETHISSSGHVHVIPEVIAQDEDDSNKKYALIIFF